MRKLISRLAFCAGAAAVAGGFFLGSAEAADKKFKIFLSMSYIGNDWQAEAANMVKAMAAHKNFADKVDLQVQVAGPNAQRQIQQINAMVQAGRPGDRRLSDLADRAERGGQERLRQGRRSSSPTMPRSPSPAPTTSPSTRRRPAASPPNGWRRSSTARATSSSSPACPARRSTRCAPRRRRKSSPSIPTSRSSPRRSACGARRSPAPNSPRSSPPTTGTRSTACGCRSAATPPTRCRSRPARSRSELKPCAGEGSNGGRIQMLPASTEVEGANGTYTPDGRAAHLLRLAALFRRLRAEARGAEARGQGRAEADHAAAAARHQRDDQATARKAPGRR